MSDDKDVFGNPWPAGAYIPLVGTEGDKAMTTPPLTPAQRAALEWLPEIGRKSLAIDNIGRGFTLGRLQKLGLVQAIRSNRYRITPAGEALRKELNKS